MIKVGIVGCSGYTALEAAEWLTRHSQAELVVATSRQADGSSLGALHPQLAERVDVTVENLSPDQIGERCDVALCCLPHAASAPIVSSLLDAGCRVVDLSADYRLSNQALYEQWYDTTHPDPSRLGNVPYGLPELFRQEMREADLVANPGCYPTSAILPLAPLMRAGLIDGSHIIVDSKSGVSGAGRTPKLAMLFAEANESFGAYAVGSHRHQPEIVDILHRYTQVSPSVVFTPHLVPMNRGILSTIYLSPGSSSPQAIHECLSDAYGNEPFVRVVEHLPATKYVRGTNYCDIAVRQNGDQVILLCAIDNLVKGASGAALQCMNVMFGLDETHGLLP